MVITDRSVPLVQLRLWAHPHNGHDDNSNYADIGPSYAAPPLGLSTLTTATVSAAITKGQHLITLPQTHHHCVFGSEKKM